jgi:hypothetical protein
MTGMYQLHVILNYKSLLLGEGRFWIIQLQWRFLSNFVSHANITRRKGW